ncbi:LytTR family DNA-binding domain-containing protein [Anaerofustis stercorihominis]|uniref:LytTR family transcriptional regulator n=1 Tax=Anaerofustis stercorihominis TaxID=214853 RepID=A0A3E3E0J4_9FIRM|nr:LytTR family DNA-binding domain-containing protein [Anaerofustis stercorihominis]RGD75072.1 LytTR family transcriptional regulator [Anaerofustis stercorihominis]
MKVKIKLNKNIKEPYAVIFTDEITEEIKNINEILSKKDNIITGNYNEKIIIIDKAEAEIIRTEEGRTTIYLNDKKCYTNKRLYEVEELLGKDFIRVSKSTIVNIKKIDYVEPSFNCTMMIVMKNKVKDYISRRYLKSFKEKLGL